MAAAKACSKDGSNENEGRVRIFERDLPPAEAKRAVQRWRMFFMACEELFAFDEGREWFVVHSLLRPDSET